MKVYTSISWSMVTGEILEEHSFDYSGPVAECKGADVAKSQMDLSNKQTSEQMSAQKQWMNNLLAALNPYLAGNGIGFSDADLNLMRGNAIDTANAQYGNADSAVKLALMRRSGGLPMSGADLGKGISSVMTAK